MKHYLTLLSLAFAAALCPLSAAADNDVIDYVLECVDYGADAVRRDVRVRFESNAEGTTTVYFQGLSEEVPDAWAHATITTDAKGQAAVFEVPQLLGEWKAYGATRKQYLTGADTSTGDVSGFALRYDETSRSFTSTASNWMLLTATPSEVGFYYDHLYNTISLLPASEAGEDPSVTPPAGLATDTYLLAGRHPYSGIPTEYTVTLGTAQRNDGAGLDVYVQGLYPAFPKAWVKGVVTMTGETGVATFTTPQYVGNYHGLYNMYVAGVEPIAEQLCELVMEYDPATRTFTSMPECWFIVQAGETNVLPMMLLDEVTIAPYTLPQPDYTLATIPAGREKEVRNYTFSAVDADDNSSVTLPASVLIDSKSLPGTTDVYVKGFSSYFPDVWVKGTLDGTVVVFPRNQYVGSMQGNDIWLGAADTMSGEVVYGNFLLVYNPATGELTQPEVNYLAINASRTSVYHLELYKSVRLTPNDAEGVHDALLTDTASPALRYDLQGRCTTAPTAGLYIATGRKCLVR